MTKSITLFRRTLLGSALLLSPVAASHCWAGRQPAIVLQIPAGSLDDALRAVGRQSGREIMYSADVVAGKRVARLTLRTTPDEAIRRLLKGTGLVADYRLDVVLIRSGDSAVTTNAEDTTEGQVTVTGTRIRGAGTTSVQSVARVKAESEGIYELGALVRTLPQNFTGGQNPGIYGGAVKGSENFSGSTALNLRGLGPDATLTLINGHRGPYDAASQGVDIGAIPLIAVERVDLLPDGASALYGSDAVAGVANVILRSPFSGLETRARVAVPTRGGGVQDQYSIIAGHRGITGGFVAAVDYLKIAPIYADQRSFTRSLDSSATILAGQRQISGLLAGRQDLGGRITATLDAQFLRRSFTYAQPFFSPGDIRTNGALSNRRVDSYSIAPGLTADLGSGWQTKLSGVHGLSTTNSHLFQYLNGRESLRSRIVYRNRLRTIELGAEGPLFDLPGGEARLAVGGGWRQVKLDGDAIAVSNGVARTTIAIAERNNVTFGYGELSLPFVGAENAVPGIRILRLNAAARFEHYQQIANVLVPKVSFRYDPIAAISVRGSWGRSFKAPTLFQLGQIPQGFLLPGSYFRPSPPLGQPAIELAGGNDTLRPERARA